MKTTLTKDDPAGWYLCDCLDSEGVRARWWSGDALKMWPTDDYLCKDPYTNFLRLYTEEEVKEKEQYLQALEVHRQNLLRDNHRLLDKLSALKASPYPMRKADKPDCVGLWLSLDKKSVFITHSDDEWVSTGDWYYLGPIPVIPAEQKPPQVVTVRNKKSDEVFRAIPSPCGKWLGIIGDDGSYLGNEPVNNWEVGS